MNPAANVGRELDIFAHARNWKRYWASHIKAYLHGDVLEVGAGIGANTGMIHKGDIRSWTCLEPDPELATRLSQAVTVGPQLQVIVGTLKSVKPESRFDALVYIDVLEHIEDDRQELVRAAAMLRPGGRLIVLAPAHQLLYSPFDRAIGHFRRYNRATLLDCQPRSVRLERILYLDSAGLIASSLNRLLLRQSTPTLAQIKTWDRLLVPLSKFIDPVLFYRLGKSILAVWVKT
jgi:SAM-dependent methyltransferase